MRKRRNGLRRLAAWVCAAVVSAAPVMAAEGGLSLFDGLGQESNQIIINQGVMPDAGNIIALDDLGVSIKADEFTVIRQEDGFVYIYTMQDGSMPYVIIGRYDTVSDDFANAFTAYMAGSYADLRVAQEAYPLTIAGNAYTKIMYEYSVGGYTVQDTRLFTALGNYTYMFGSKEVPSLAYTVETGYLDQVAGSIAFLAGGDSDYENHVDAMRSVEGSGLSVADLGGFGTDKLPGMGDDTQSDTTYGDTGTSMGQADVTGTDYTGTNDDGNGGMTQVGGTVGDTGSVAGTSATAGSITFDESVAGYDGVWVPFDDGFKLYLPSFWNTYIVSEEQQQMGCLYQAGDATGSSATPAYIAVNFGESGGLTTLDELAQGLAMSGYTVDDTITVNGIDCISYGMDSQDLSGLMFFYPYSRDYIFAVVGYNYSYNVDTLAAILCSLSLNI